MTSTPQPARLSPPSAVFAVVDDLAAGELRLCPGAQRHGVHVGHEHDPRLVVHRAAAGQIDDEVAGLGRHGNAGVGVVEADRLRRHAASFSAAASSRPIAASFPVTPSTARKRMRRSVAA